MIPRKLLVLTILLLFLSPILLPHLTYSASPNHWLVIKNGNELRFHYGSGTTFPQYGVLHLNDSYLRLNYGPNSGWGTSVILLPVFWSASHCPPPGLCQGAPVSATYQINQSYLQLSITGTTGGLQVSSKVYLLPPLKNQAITAYVVTSVTGTIPLDPRLNEAFKPVMLSSMHISSTQWDTEAAYGCLRTSPIPAKDWIFQPPAYVNIFGLQGGTSAWKTNAPTVEIELDRALPVTGWVTSSNDPNDDNVAFWAASDQVLPFWSYKITVAPAPGPKYNCLSLSKWTNPSPVQPGSALTFTIRLTNTTGVTFTASVTDTLPSRVTPNGDLYWSSIVLGPSQVWTQSVVVTAPLNYIGPLYNHVFVSTVELRDTAGAGACVVECVLYLPIILK